MILAFCWQRPLVFFYCLHSKLQLNREQWVISLWRNDVIFLLQPGIVCVLLLALAELVEIRKTSIIASFVLDSFVLWGAMCLVLWKAGAMVCLWIWPRKEGYHLACVWWFECVLSYCFHKDRWNPTCHVWLLRTCLLNCLCAQKDMVLWILGISNTIAYLSFIPWQRQQKYCKRQHEAMMNNIKSKIHFDLGIRN